MLPVYQNIPFVCIFLCMISGISMPLFKKGRSAYRLMLFVCAVVKAFYKRGIFHL